MGVGFLGTIPRLVALLHPHAGNGPSASSELIFIFACLFFTSLVLFNVY